MRFFFFLLLTICTWQQLAAQDQPDSVRMMYPFYKRTLHHDIYVGFSRGPKVDSLDATYTSLEVGYARSVVIQGMHGGSATLYAGQEIGLSQKKLLHGTKAGFWAGFSMFTLGMELSHLTDYIDHAFYFWPSFGIGNYPLNISIAPRVRLSGKGFQPQNKVRLNLSIALFRIKTKDLISGQEHMKN